MPAKIFKMTLSLRGYTPGQNAWSLEADYTTASTGPIREVREQLREIAFPHFQNAIRRIYGMHVSRDEIKGRFELEQSALAPSDTIHVEIFETIYYGRQHYARKLAGEEIPFETYDFESQNEADEAYASDEEYEEENGEEDETDDDSDPDQDYEDEETDEEDEGEFEDENDGGW
jgi:hypothetical protein